MKPSATLPTARDKLLFTPGPLTTSLSVKQAMLHDAGSWHFEFNAKVNWVREKILEIAGLSRDAGWEAILLQGSGTFGVEAVFATCVPPSGKVAVLANGAYGERIVLMLQHLKIDHLVLRTPENTPNDPAALDRALATDKTITHVAIVHCETTTGILNPITEVGRVVQRHSRHYIVDAMSSFAAIPIDFSPAGIDFLISSANKCLEGVPGFSFVICRRDALLACEGYARCLSLDLLDQLKGFDKNGQFRYTPPTHPILAFEQAMKELEHEGGVAGRGARYRRNHETLVKGMKQLGFRPYLDPAVQSYIITSFYYPDTEKFSFDDFYRRLSDKGFIIYPGKISRANTFRIGSIGRISPSDIDALVSAIDSVLKERGVKMV
ncbi:MAG: 2-aminoethylphosphonate--pyruvate transaminase [Verrucomicrobia bacterium]|nr:MAG: 2-aminoethylphosphonate--pyruvate transaminase [Verrucomicrobiota bacterium]PYJ96464.1 MAG: 2-aminoethylphosphonate--pyruvate transaminase [Verrucomicrobiota bacterium]